MAKSIILLAPGFEEIEAISIIDILRRAGEDLTVAGVSGYKVEGGHGITVKVDALLDDVINQSFDTLILPGGEPGVTNLENNESVKTVILNQATSQKFIAAICAAPRILNNLGLLNGKTATSHPGTKEAMTKCTYSEERVVLDGNILTSRGPGTSAEFAYAILDKLGQTEKSTKLKDAMLYK